MAFKIKRLFFGVLLRMLLWALHDLRSASVKNGHSHSKIVCVFQHWHLFQIFSVNRKQTKRLQVWRPGIRTSGCFDSGPTGSCFRPCPEKTDWFSVVVFCASFLLFTCFVFMVSVSCVKTWSWIYITNMNIMSLVVHIHWLILLKRIRFHFLIVPKWFKYCVKVKACDLSWTLGSQERLQMRIYVLRTLPAPPASDHRVSVCSYESAPASNQSQRHPVLLRCQQLWSNIVWMGVLGRSVQTAGPREFWPTVSFTKVTAWKSYGPFTDRTENAVSSTHTLTHSLCVVRTLPHRWPLWEGITMRRLAHRKAQCFRLHLAACCANGSLFRGSNRSRTTLEGN